ncbi:MAG: hypothetical protein AAGM36_05180, partial [Cyanobacteria bacterium J06597_1]
MSSPPSDGPSVSNSQESSPPLGLRNLLLPPPPLGQRSSSSAFRLGSRTLTVLAPLRTSNRLSDRDPHPPIAQRRSSHSGDREQDNNAPPLSSQASPTTSSDRRSGSLSSADAPGPPQHSGAEESLTTRKESPTFSSTHPVQDPPRNSPSARQAKSQGIDTVDESGANEAQSPADSEPTHLAEPPQVESINPADGLTSRQRLSKDRVGDSLDSDFQSSSHTPSIETAKVDFPTSESTERENTTALQRSSSSQQLPTVRNNSPLPTSTSEGFSQKTTEPAERVSSEPASALLERNDGAIVEHANDPPTTGEGRADNPSLTPSHIQAKSNSPSSASISHSPAPSGQTTHTTDRDSSATPFGASEATDILQANDASNPVPSVQAKQSESAPSQAVSISAIRDESIDLPASTPASSRAKSGQDAIVTRRDDSFSPETTSPPDLQASLGGEPPLKDATEHHAQPPAVQAEGAPVEETPASLLQRDESRSPERRSTSETSSNLSTFQPTAPSSDRAQVSKPETAAIQRQAPEGHIGQVADNATSSGVEATTVPTNAALSSFPTNSPPPTTDRHSTAPANQAASATESGSPAIDSRDVRQAAPFASREISAQIARSTTASNTASPSQTTPQPEPSDAEGAEERSRQQQSPLLSNPQVESRPSQQANLSSGESPSPATPLQGRSSNPDSIQRQTDSTAIPSSYSPKAPEASPPTAISDESDDLKNDSEPERSQLPTHNAQESSSGDVVFEQDRSEIPGLQRSPASLTEAAASEKPLPTSAEHPHHSTELPSSSLTPPPSSPETAPLSINNSNEHRTTTTKSSTTSSSSAETVQRSPESHPSPTTSAALQPLPSDSGQSVGEKKHNGPSKSPDSTSKIQLSASPSSEEQAGYQSASTQPSEVVTPSHVEQPRTTSIRRERTSLTSDTTAHLPPKPSTQTSPQYSPASKTCESDSSTTEVDSNRSDNQAIDSGCPSKV